MSEKPVVPPEAARIMAAMVRMPPKPHDQMKLGKSRAKSGSKASRKSDRLNVCPECGHVFQGDGWDGIDAHWKSKHEYVMPYSEAWPLIQGGTYKSDR
jgi:hypothetical protein